MAVTAHAQLSSNADLGNITLSTGSLSPDFAANNPNYSAVVSTATASITVTPTAAVASATIKVRVNGGTFATVASGTASAALPLSIGQNAIDIKVTAENAVTINDYAISVTRLGSVIGLLQGTPVANGSTRAFSAAPVGGSSSMFFAIKNTGPADLAVTSVSVTGGNVGDFTVDASGVSSPVAALNGETYFTVAFNPAVLGARSTTLRIVSDDAVNGIYNVTLNGLGVVSNGPGSLDPVLDPYVDGNQVDSLAVLPDGNILIGGSISSIDGQERGGLARLFSDGELDTSFLNEHANVTCLTVQPDGSILFGGGYYDSVTETSGRMGRLFPDGTLDTSFQPAPGNSGASITSITVLPSGKLLVTGNGDFLGAGAVKRKGIARFNADGTMDTSFNADLLGIPYHFAPDGNLVVVSNAILQPDGQIVIAGLFTSVGGVPRFCLARLNPNGSLESSATFASVITNYVSAPMVALQADGKLLVGGAFKIGTTERYLARFNADGTLDASYNPPVQGQVSSICVQANGRVLISGSYIPDVGGYAMINPDGTLAPDFIYPAGGSFGDMVIQADGKILQIGSVYGNTIGGQPRHGLARFENEPATQSLIVPDATRVQWLRGGSSPEATEVIFDVSTDDGVTYTPLGFGTRISGGWELTGLSLPSICQVRARARTPGAKNGGCIGLVEAATVFGRPSSPHLIVQHPRGTNLANGASHAFGNVLVDSVLDHTFVIKNTGDAVLTDFDLTLTGTGASSFAVSSNPSTTVNGPSGSTTFSVQFAPTTTGLKTAMLHIASNDPASSPFDIPLSGTGLFSNNANLSQLTTDYPGQYFFVESFDPEVTEYTLNLPYHVTRIAFVPTKAQADATIKVNGTTVISGETSNDISIPVGTTVIPVVVTAQDGTTTKTYTITITRPAALPGQFDVSFAPEVMGGIAPLYERRVACTAVQPDGKILIGGQFDLVSGVPRQNLARLNADGTLDTSFNPEVGYVVCMIVQPDGKILIGGTFAFVNGELRLRIARLNADGTLDSSFDADLPGSGPNPTGQWLRINCMSFMPDGKLLVGGQFQTTSGISDSHLLLMNADGSNPQVFARFKFVTPPNTAIATATIHYLLVQPNGDVLVAGGFNKVSANATSSADILTPSLVRFHANGDLDTTFAPVPGTANQAPDNIYAGVACLAIQTDGKILVGGSFDEMNNEEHWRLARLNSDGSIDSSFAPRFYGGFYVTEVKSLALQADGKILVGGEFYAPKIRVVRLLADGTVDDTFPFEGAGKPVYSVALQADGKALFGSANGVARLINQPATQSLTVPNSREVTWLRGGSSPEALSVTFEVSTDNGSTWALLDPPTRIAGGWQLLDQSLPANVDAILRARAQTNGGQGGAAYGLVETTTSFNVPDTSPPKLRPVVIGTLNPSHAYARAGNSVYIDFTVNETIQAPMVTIAGRAAVTKNLGGNNWSSEIFVAALDPEGEVPFSVSVTDLAGNTRSTSNPTDGSLVKVDHTPPVITLNGANPATVFQGTTYNEAGATALDAIAGSVSVSTSGTVDVSTLGAYTITYSATDPAGHFASSTRTVNLSPAPPGTALTFEPEITQSPGVQGDIFAVALQPDGKTVIGGRFTSVDGLPRRNIARLNADGSVDADFDPSADGLVRCVAVQPDGKVLLGGAFTELQPNGAASPATRHQIARVFANGTLDEAFATAVFDDSGLPPQVYCLNVQENGLILVGGEFTSVQGTGTLDQEVRHRMARLNLAGQLDNAFKPQVDGHVASVAVQPDGMVIIAGAFGSINGDARSNIARVNDFGVMESAFDPVVNDAVLNVLVQPDGKLLIGGDFTSIDGTARSRVARLNADGNLDASFAPSANNTLTGMALQTDGKVLLCGDFTLVNGLLRHRIARVDSSGVLDGAFDPDADGSVTGAAIRPDGKVLIVGSFHQVGGQPHGPISLLANDAATQTLSALGRDHVQWDRGGAGPEVDLVGFDYSSNGLIWLALGDGVRTATGWECTGLNMPITGRLRARAYLRSGASNGSLGLIQTTTTFVIPSPQIQVTQGGFITNGGGNSFGNVMVTTETGHTFTIANIGDALLTGLQTTITGPNADQFVLTTPPVAPVGPSGTTPLIVTFSPTSVGTKTATLTITSDDPDDESFTIVLNGVGFFSTDATLATLTINAGSLSPAFNPATQDYSVAVGNGTSALAITPTTSAAVATIKVNGVTVQTGQASANVPLVVGSNLITVRVTAQDGTTIGDYTVTVVREPFTSPTFGSSGKFAYGANTGWLNFSPATGNGVAVGESYLTGYAWDANTGWVNLGNGTPANGYAYSNTDSVDAGVNHDGAGKLSGLAYSANVGWIKFGWAGANDPNRPRINLITGAFTGFAYGANMGWINLGTGRLTTDSIISPDTDVDGIADAWEMRRFGALNIGGVGTDTDHDGQSDAAEYIADTDPLNPGESLSITSETISPDRSQITLVFHTTSSARLYRVQQSTTLLATGPGAWEDVPELGTFLTPTPDTAATFSLPPGPARFFRVVVVKPLQP